MTGFAELRKRRNLTQQELADIVGIHKNHLQKIEYGTIDIETIEFATGLRLAKALDINPTRLINIHKNNPA